MAVRACAGRKPGVRHWRRMQPMSSTTFELRLKQAQAMLDLFEGDRQQAAATLEELREWANAQDQEHLQFRVDHYVQFESEARRMGCRVRPASRNIPPVLESCTDSALVPDRDAAAFALEAEIAMIVKDAGVRVRPRLQYRPSTWPPLLVEASGGVKKAVERAPASFVLLIISIRAALIAFQDLRCKSPHL